MALLRSELVKLREKQKCVWTDANGSHNFETSCGELYSMRLDLDVYAYCPFCGGLVEEQNESEQ
jgi:hypothetical protein